MSGDIGGIDMTCTHHYAHAEIKEMLAKTASKYERIAYSEVDTPTTLLLALLIQLLTQVDELMADNHEARQ